MGNQESTPTPINDDDITPEQKDSGSNRIILSGRQSELNLNLKMLKESEKEIIDESNMYKPKKKKFIKCEFNRFSKYACGEGKLIDFIEDIENYEKSISENNANIMKIYPNTDKNSLNVNVRENIREEITEIVNTIQMTNSTNIL